MTERIESIRRQSSTTALAGADKAKLEEWAVELYDRAGACSGQADDIENRNSLTSTPEGTHYWLQRARDLRSEAHVMELGAEALLTLAGYSSESPLKERLRDAEAANRELYHALEDLGLHWGGDYEPAPGTDAWQLWDGRRKATRAMQRYLESRQASPAAAAE